MKHPIKYLSTGINLWPLGKAKIPDPVSILYYITSITKDTCKKFKNNRTHRKRLEDQVDKLTQELIEEFNLNGYSDKEKALARRIRTIHEKLDK